MSERDQKLEGVEFFECEDFIHNLRAELDRPFTELKIIIFKLTYSRLFKILIPAIETGLANGSKVELHLDGIFSNEKLSKGFSLLPFGENHDHEMKMRRELKSSLELLIAKGAKVTYFNKPNWLNKYVLPFAFRDHRKLFIIKRENSEHLAYFGATNLDDGYQNDFMIKVEDNASFKILEKFANHSWMADQEDDIEEKVNDQMSLLLDVGQNFKSGILRKGYSLIESSKKRIVFVSQLPPEPLLLLRFVRAKLRGVDVSIVLPPKDHEHLNVIPLVFAYWANLLAAKLLNIKIYNSVKGFTHAKILIADDQVLLGSHNLSNVGVAAGTVEISALINNTNFLTNVEEFVDSLRYPELLEEKNLLFKQKYNLLKSKKENSGF